MTITIPMWAMYVAIGFATFCVGVVAGTMFSAMILLDDDDCKPEDWR
jgi:hypothetical protein